MSQTVKDPMASEGVIRMAVRRCARCSGDHPEGLTFRPLDRPNEAWTHWSSCPANGQPIMLRTQGGTHSDDPIMLHSLAAVAAEAPPEERMMDVLPPPMRSIVDHIAEVTRWDGQGWLANHVERLVRLHKPDVLDKIVRAIQGESLRLSGLGVPHNLDSLALALVNYRDGQ